jgi:ribosomal protein S18 acetylase RimI-like enzyme
MSVRLTAAALEKTAKCVQKLKQEPNSDDAGNSMTREQEGSGRNKAKQELRMGMDAGTLRGAFSRTQDGVRRHGLGGTLRLAGRRLTHRVYMKEAHRWYELDLTGERPRKELPAGFSLVRANADQLPLIKKLPTVKLEEAERRHRDDAALWLVLEGETPAFACWTFFGRLPVFAASEGALALPPHTVGLEDSVTSPDYRGRGLAPAAWSMISDILVSEGYTTMITKVAEENVPSRKAVEKAGFQDVAGMRLVRLGSRRTVSVEASGSGVSDYLRDHLSR